MHQIKVVLNKWAQYLHSSHKQPKKQIVAVIIVTNSLSSEVLSCDLASLEKPLE